MMKKRPISEGTSRAADRAKRGGKGGRQRKGREESADDLGLMEKYLHSQGAALFDDGRWDEAIHYLNKANLLDEQSYTCYHLCLTYLEKKDHDKALDEITRAIELNPSVAKYYFRRSFVWQLKGNKERADADYQEATRLDANYGRIDRIRSCCDAVEQAFTDTRMLDWCSDLQLKSKELRSTIEEFTEALQDAHNVVGNASCQLSCPSYCCHFSGEAIRHGVHIGPWKLRAIREFLKKKGLSETDFLGRMPFTREEHIVKLIPPHHVVKEGTEESVYYPKRRKGRLGKALLKNLPKARDYQELLWINQDARPCAFLHERQCVIHDIGGETGLPACKEFLCLTGFVVVALRHLGLISQPEIEELPMAALNRVAVEALLVLGGRLYNDYLVRMETDMVNALKAAADADAKDAMDELRRHIDEYRRLRKEYGQAFAAASQVARKEIEALLSAEQETGAFQ